MVSISPVFVGVVPVEVSFKLKENTMLGSYFIAIFFLLYYLGPIHCVNVVGHRFASPRNRSSNRSHLGHVHNCANICEFLVRQCSVAYFFNLTTKVSVSNSEIHWTK